MPFFLICLAVKQRPQENSKEQQQQQQQQQQVPFWDWACCVLLLLPSQATPCSSRCGRPAFVLIPSAS